MRFLFCVLFFISSLLLIGQNNTPFELIEITNEEAELFIKTGKIKLSASKPILKNTEAGKHYLKISPNGKTYELYSTNTFKILLIPIRNGLACKVISNLGIEIKEAKVSVGEITIPYNPELNCYLSKSIISTSLLKAEYKSEVCFLKIFKDLSQQLFPNDFKKSNSNGIISFEKEEYYKGDSIRFYVFHFNNGLQPCTETIKVSIKKILNPDIQIDSVLTYQPDLGYCIPDLGSGSYLIRTESPQQKVVYGKFEIKENYITWGISIPENNEWTNSIPIQMATKIVKNQYKHQASCKLTIRLDSSQIAPEIQNISIPLTFYSRNFTIKSDTTFQITIPASIFKHPTAKYSIQGYCHGPQVYSDYTRSNAFIVKVEKKDTLIRFQKEEKKIAVYGERTFKQKNTTLFTRTSKDSVYCDLQNPLKLPIIYQVLDNSGHSIEKSDTSFHWAISRKDPLTYFLCLAFQDSLSIESLSSILHARSDFNIEIDYSYFPQKKSKSIKRNFYVIKDEIKRPICYKKLVEISQSPYFSQTYFSELNKGYKAPEIETTFNYRGYVPTPETQNTISWNYQPPPSGSQNTRYEPTKDPLAQISPMIFKHGRAQFIHLIKIDTTIVYINGLKKNNPKNGNYSFVSTEGFHQIKLYTRNTIYTIDSVLLKNNTRLHYTILVDEKLPGNISTRCHSSRLPKKEYIYLKTHQLQIKSTLPSYIDHFWIGGKNNMVLLKTPCTKSILHSDSIVFLFIPGKPLQSISTPASKSITIGLNGISDTLLPTDTYLRSYSKFSVFDESKTKFPAITMTDFPSDAKTELILTGQTFNKNATLIIKMGESIQDQNGNTIPSDSLLGFRLQSPTQKLIFPHNNQPKFNITPGSYILYAATKNGAFYRADSVLLDSSSSKIIFIQRVTAIQASQEMLNSILSLNEYAYKIYTSSQDYYWTFGSDVNYRWSAPPLSIPHSEDYTFSYKPGFAKKNKYFFWGASLLNGLPSSNKSFVSNWINPGVSLEMGSKFHPRYSLIFEASIQHLVIPELSFKTFTERFNGFIQADLFEHRSRYQKRRDLQPYFITGFSIALVKSDMNLIFPFGAGINYKLSKQSNLGLEYSYYSFSILKPDFSSGKPVHNHPIFSLIKLRLQVIIPRRVVFGHFR